MIIIKYAIYYTFIGVYQTKLALGKLGSLLVNRLRKLNNSNYNQGELTGVRSSLLRAAFRSIL